MAGGAIANIGIADHATRFTISTLRMPMDALNIDMHHLPICLPQHPRAWAAQQREAFYFAQKKHIADHKQSSRKKRPLKALAN